MSLLVSKTPDRYNGKRHIKRSEVNPVLPRWQFVISLHLSGKTAQEISELSGYSTTTIYAILSHPDSIALRQQILKGTAQEFEALFEEVVSVIRGGLKSDDERIRLESAEKWLKAHGKYQPNQVKQEINLSAEDVVIQILNQNQEESEGGIYRRYEE